MAHIAGLVDHIVNEGLHLCFCGELAPFADEGVKFCGGFFRLGRKLECWIDETVDEAALRVGDVKIDDLVPRLLADAALGNVDDAVQADGVVGVGHDVEIGEDVLDLAALEKFDAAVDLVWQMRLHEHLLDGAELGRGADEHGEIAVVVVGSRHDVADLPHDEVSFVAVVVGFVVDDLAAFWILGPEGFVFAGGIVGDDGVGEVEDGLGGAVVFLELDHGGVRIVLFEAEDVLHIGAAPLVDGLVVVADDTDVTVFRSEEMHQLVLDAVGVLVLIDEDVLEAVLVFLENVGMLAEELRRQAENIVEIDGVVLRQGVLVIADDLQRERWQHAGLGVA